MDVVGEKEALQQFFNGVSKTEARHLFRMDPIGSQEIFSDPEEDPGYVKEIMSHPKLLKEVGRKRDFWASLLRPLSTGTQPWMIGNQWVDCETGQDVSIVFDSAVDTSILEQYLSNETDPTFMLPESPPDSGSERSSPPQLPGSGWSVEQNSEHSSPACIMESWKPDCFGPGGHVTYNAYVSQLHSTAGSSVYGATSCPAQEHRQHSRQEASVISAASSSPSVSAALQPETLYPHARQQHLSDGLHEQKKRRRSNTYDGATGQDSSAWAKPAFCPESETCEPHSYDSDGGSLASGAHQLLTWERFQHGNWSSLCNSRFETLPPPGFHVDTDKGFTYSAADDAFVCQKKNHFQVTVHIGMVGDPKHVTTPAGPMPVQSFYVKVFGVKLEAQKHMVTVEQSQSDRSKKPFLPVSVNLPGDKITKVTLGRLHFSETTSNNMRKKGKPNPDQRYIMLVVGLYATVNQDSFLLVAHVSERIIVRASNPGQFESDPDSLWQKGQAPESVVCHGRLGINTDVPDEALVVCGNAKIMGNVMHPSDRRAKENIQEVDPTDQLKRISQMRIVEYDYKPEFASTMGIDHVHETGIIAQEVRELLPSAVKEMGEVNCANGETIDGFLMVDKEQIFMENVGAVKQLCKLTDNLETRIQELEVWNARLSKLKTLGSSRTGSTKGKISKTSKSCTNPNPSKQPGLQSRKNNFRGKYLQCVRHRVFQASIFMLVTTMALCIISITALYLLNLQDDMDFNSSHNNSHLFPTHSTVTADPTSAFTTAARGPPDIDFSEVFYSDHVYCCPGLQNHTLHSMSHSGLRSTPEKRPEDRTHSTDWTDTTVQSIFITQNEQTIAEQYCEEGKCGRGIYSFLIPVSKHLPPNMPITLQMNTNQLLVLHLCWYQENEPCSSALDHSRPKYSARLNTQGHVHRWTVGVASHHHAVYRFRSSVAGLADCSTDLNFAEVLFTDYHFHFYRRCE